MFTPIHTGISIFNAGTFKLENQCLIPQLKLHRRIIMYPDIEEELNQSAELKTFERFISNYENILISRLNSPCSPLVINLEINNKRRTSII